MFHRLGHLSASYPWAVCLAWLVIGVAIAISAPHFDARAEDDDICFIPDRFTSVRAYKLLQQAFPHDVYASRVVFVLERQDASLGNADFQLADDLALDLEVLRQEAPELKLGKIDSHQDGLVGARMVSADRQCTLIQVSLETPFLALGTANAVDRAERIARERLVRSGIHGLALYTTGAAGIGRDINRGCGSSMEGTSWATVLLVVVVLLAVYRAPLLALVPLVTIGVSVWVALNGLALLTLIPGVHLINISKVFAIVILYGAGTDYCLFLISRYREELQAGHRVRAALARGVGGVGTALAASAATVMVGLALMACAEFAKVRYAGPAIAASLGVALLASLTLTPALLALMGKHVFWPTRPPMPVAAGFGPRAVVLPIRLPKLGLWDWVSHVVARRPGLVWLFAAVVLLPLVVVGLRVQPDYRATAELSPRAESLRGLAAIQRHFTAGEVGPITVLLTSEEDWSSPDGRRQIAHLSGGFARLPNVAEVRSLTQPLGMALPELRTRPDGHGLLHELILLLQPLLSDFNKEVVHAAREHYVAQVHTGGESSTRFVTRLDVVLKSDPFDPASIRTLRLIQTWLHDELPRYRYVSSEVCADCYGVTANGQDLAEVIDGDRCRVNSLVLGAILLILMALVRRLWLAVYLLITVLASYYAALGATALMAGMWSGTSHMSLDWRVPFFLFTILVAVGEDYNILLVSRAIEERKRHGPVEGMRRALSRTGGAITSCGIIMAGTFATLMLGGLNSVSQIGFALAFGVLVDTFVVRPFLVPACAMIYWRTAPKSKSEIRISKPETNPKFEIRKPPLAA
jgi:RND superfamily putative drug exporter